MSRTGLSMQSYVNYIKLQLGAPIVKVELDDFIPDIVNMALDELKSYITDVETLTVPYAQVIDLSEKKVGHIHYLMRAQQNISVAGLQDMMYIYTSRNRSSFPNNSFTLSDYARGLMVQQNKASLSTDLEFYFDKKEDKLYVYAQQVLPASITIVYTPDYETVEEIIEPFWQDKLKRLALALTKEALGRVRGKYTLNSATYNLDADQLLSESQSELAEIRTYLNNNKDLLLPLD